ncbi:MAG: AlkA N-terminal domain-containing protein [Acidimicrobiales bacterium]
MDTATEAWMRAVESRDARFDGWVTVGVTSTGIYCRPSCPTPVRPKRTNMRFFSTPAAAQQAGFRSCKRCAPDATPGSPEWNRRDDLVARAVRAIDDGEVDRSGVAGLADHLGVSARHLQRVLTEEVGTGPKALARARRGRAARVLIETTTMSFAEISVATGFRSVRQFNDTISSIFATTPREMRRKAGSRRTTGPGEWIPVRLSYRPPLASRQLLRWLNLHAVVGVEEVEGHTYRRSLRLPGGVGVVEVDIQSTSRDMLPARFRLQSMADLPQAINRVRRLLDLDADPLVIAADLGADSIMASLVEGTPGLRSPGEVSGTDAAIRAVLHQQVSLASARSMTARLVAAHGIALPNPVGTIRYAFPDAGVWARADADSLGLPESRAQAVVNLGAALHANWVDLSPWADRTVAISAITRIKGIGPWTANIVAAKALADPDAFGANDLALLRQAEKLGLPGNAAELEQRAERWRPWRSYAMHHLWNLYLNELEQQ